MTRIQGVVAIAANGALLVAALIAAAFLMQRMRVQGRAGPSPMPSYEVNELLPDTIPLDFTRAQRTVLLVVHSLCHYCTDGMPFYRKLQQMRSKGTSFAVVGRESQDVLERYVASNDLRPDAVATIPREALKALGTPQLIIVDSRRRVQAAWMGALDSAREEEIIGLLAAPGARR